MANNTPLDTDSTGWHVYDGSQTPPIAVGVNYSKVAAGSLASFFSWSPNIEPRTGVPLGAAFRTSKLTVSYAAGTWQLKLALHGNKHDLAHFTYGTQIEARLFKSTLPEGYNASPPLQLAAEITPIIGESNQFSIIDNGTGIATINFAMPKINFNNEYLFLQFAIKSRLSTVSLAAGPDNTFDVIIDYGINTFLTTTSYAPFDSGAFCGDSPNQSEMYIYYAPDGTAYPLDTGTDKIVLTDTGTGTPSIEYITSTGPYQDGESLRAVKLKPRIVQLVIFQTGQNRAEYWNLRGELLRQISPRKQTIDNDLETGVLRRINSLGTKRDLNCLIQEGPKFEPRDLNTWRENSFTETLRFMAFDPIYIDPTEKSYTFDKQGSQLTFPITFPIYFNTILQDVSLQYYGTWKCFPKFVITGPTNFIYIRNNTTDEDISIQYDLLAGETITLTLDYGSKSIVKNDGTNLIQYILEDSELGTFHLTEANLGLNELHVHLTGVNASSQIQMFYHDRYWGI